MSFPYTNRYIKAHIYLHYSIQKNTFASASKASTPTNVKTYVDVVSGHMEVCVTTSVIIWSWHKHKICFSEIRSYFVNFAHVPTHIILRTHICKVMFVHVSVCDMIHVLLCKHLLYVDDGYTYENLCAKCVKEMPKILFFSKNKILGICWNTYLNSKEMPKIFFFQK